MMRKRFQFPLVVLLCGIAPYTYAVPAHFYPGCIYPPPEASSEYDMFHVLDELSSSEEAELMQRLASIPQDVLERGSEDEIRTILEAGLLPLGSDSVESERVLPALVIAVRVGICLASAYAAISAIKSDSSAASIASQIAVAVAGCVGAPAKPIASAILKHKDKIAKALKAIGLTALANGLLTGS